MASTTVEFATSKNHEVGEEVAGVVVEIGGAWHAARVRITGVVGKQVTERPAWMRPDSEGGRLYPLTETTYQAEVIRSRPTSAPAASDALGRHESALENED